VTVLRCREARKGCWFNLDFDRVEGLSNLGVYDSTSKFKKKNTKSAKHRRTNHETHENHENRNADCVASPCWYSIPSSLLERRGGLAVPSTEMALWFERTGQLPQTGWSTVCCNTPADQRQLFLASTDAGRLVGSADIGNLAQSHGLNGVAYPAGNHGPQNQHGGGDAEQLKQQRATKKFDVAADEADKKQLAR